MTDERATEPLVRTVDHLKNTTTNMRGFADSVDHLLSALEEFFPSLKKLLPVQSDCGVISNRAAICIDGRLAADKHDVCPLSGQTV